MFGYDLTGKTFGSLKIIRRVDPSELTNPPKNQSIVWECFCERCESTTYCTANNLLHQGNRYCQKCKKRLFSKAEELKILEELKTTTIAKLTRKYNCARNVIYGIIKRHNSN